MIMTRFDTWSIPSLSDVIDPGTYELRIHINHGGPSDPMLSTVRMTVAGMTTIGEMDKTLTSNYSGKAVSIIWIRTAPDPDHVTLTREEYDFLVGEARGGISELGGTNWAKASARLDEITERHSI